MISLCITTYNRLDLVLECFRDVLDDERVSEIVIVDDASDKEIYDTLEAVISDIDNPKVKLYRNENNLDCYLNKRRAVQLATNDWVIIFDSDNILTKEYIDQLYEARFSSAGASWWSWKRIYQPSFAKPLFDFTVLQGQVIDKTNVGIYLGYSCTETMLNAMNYFVNRHTWLEAFDDSVNPVTSDSLYQNYNLLKDGCEVYVVPGLTYEHRVHDGSHYKQNVKRTPQGFHESILQKLKEL